MVTKIEAMYYKSPLWIQNVLVTLAGYHLYWKRYTGIYRNILSEVREARAWTSAERDAYQTEQMHNMLRHCESNVPYYQNLFSEYGYKSNQFTNLSDLRKLPLLDKETVRKSPHLFISEKHKPHLIQHTSGTTGSPLRLAVDERTYKMAMALLVEHEEFHGVPFRSKRATFAGRIIQKVENLSPPFARTNLAENQRLYSSYHLNEKTFPHYREDLDKFSPTEIIGYPSAISDLANLYLATNNSPNFRPKAIITNSETLLPSQRMAIEKVFKCKVRDYYGTAEYIIFAGQDQKGIYRVNPTLGVAEVIRSKVLPNEQELVCSTLTNYSMPLIRYCIGDTATPFSDASTNTIRTDSIRHFDGRLDDYLITPEGQRVGRIGDIVSGVFGAWETQVIQDQLDHCIVRVAIKKDCKIFEEKKLVDNLRQRLGNRMRITVDRVSRIEKGANGKFKTVISLINKETIK